MFNCKLDKLPLEVITSWTIGHVPVIPYKTKYLTCLRKHKAYDKFRNKCHKPLRSRCPGQTVINLHNRCHLYMERTRMAASGKYVEDMEGFPPIQTYISCREPIQDAVKTCLPLLLKECQKRPIRASKILRGNMSSMADILKDFPKLKVIHLLRDPRGIIMSRKRTFDGFIPNLDFGTQARLLCTKMREDIRQRRELAERYPGLTMEMTYERLARNPLKYVEAIYKFVGIHLTNLTKNWIVQSTPKSYNISVGWRNKINESIKREIDAECADLYAVTPYHS